MGSEVTHTQQEQQQIEKPATASKVLLGAAKGEQE